MAELPDDYVTVRKGVMSQGDWQRPKSGDGRAGKPMHTGNQPTGQRESNYDRDNRVKPMSGSNSNSSFGSSSQEPVNKQDQEKTY